MGFREFLRDIPLPMWVKILTIFVWWSIYRAIMTEVMLTLEFIKILEEKDGESSKF